jgi:hypothetical protein
VAELTTEQKKAIALAQARMRLSQSGEQPEQMGRGEDALRSFASGVGNAATSTLGAFGDVGRNVGSGAEWLAGQAGVSPETSAYIGRGARALVPLGSLPSSETFQPIADYTQHDPQYFTGDVSKRAGELLPGLAMPGGSMAAKVGSLAGSAILGPAAREGAEQFEVTKPYANYADMLGSLVGGFAPEIVKKVVTPHPASLDRQRMAKALEGEDIDLTAGQKTGDEALHYKESQTGGGAYNDIRTRQRDQFTSAALRKAGIEAADAGTPEVFNEAHRVLGAEFDRLEGYGIQPDTTLFEDLVTVRDKYQAYTAQSQQVPGIQKAIDDIAGKAQQGTPIDGTWLKRLGTELRDQARKARVSDPVKAETLNELIETLDDAVERTIANVSPDDAGAFRDVRTKYRNLLTLEEAAASNASGQISPAGLTAATKKMETRRGYSRGFGPFNKMAREGDIVMREPPQSGTASRFGQMGLDTPTMVGSATGTLAGAALGNPAAGWALGTLAGKGTRLAQDAIRMNPAYQKYLANQLMTGFDTKGTSARAIANALLAETNRDRSK